MRHRYCENHSAAGPTAILLGFLAGCPGFVGVALQALYNRLIPIKASPAVPRLEQQGILFE